MIPYNAVSCVPYEYMVWERKSVVKVGPLLLAQSRDAGGGVDAAGSGNSADSGSIKSVSSINSGSSSDADFSNTCSGNDMFKSGSVCGKGYRCSVTPAADPDESFLRTYDVELSSYSDSIKIKMCDYASACKAVEPDERYFNIYL